MIYTRPKNRPLDSLREIEVETNFLKHGEGSCLIKFGNTHVACIATIEERVPPFLKGKGSGWITAEYGMLPRSTESRMQRDSSKGGPNGRTHEIQRLIGRSLRSVVNLKLLGERQIIVDCDVINADGGTRTAAITGGFIALYQACQKLVKDKAIRNFPVTSQIAAVSSGILYGNHILDLEYTEDSMAEVDANFVILNDNKLVEVQATAENKSFSDDDFLKMLKLAKKGTEQLFQIQKQILGI